MKNLSSSAALHHGGPRGTEIFQFSFLFQKDPFVGPFVGPFAVRVPSSIRVRLQLEVHAAAVFSVFFDFLGRPGSQKKPVFQGFRAPVCPFLRVRRGQEVCVGVRRWLGWAFGMVVFEIRRNRWFENRTFSGFSPSFGFDGPFDQEFSRRRLSWRGLDERRFCWSCVCPVG